MLNLIRIKIILLYNSLQLKKDLSINNKIINCDNFNKKITYPYLFFHLFILNTKNFIN